MTEQLKISIWGTSRAGKTVYLVALFWAFQSMKREWAIRAADSKSETFIDRAREDIFVHHRFPDKTRTTEVYRYMITRLRDQREFMLDFLDAPGEVYAEYYDTSEQKEKRQQRVYVAQRDEQDQLSDRTPQEMFEELASSQGILMMLDPAWKYNPLRNQPYDQLLAQLLRDLKRRVSVSERTSPFIALCYTKIDALDDLWQFAQRFSSFDSLHNCYRYRSYSGENPCETNCLIYRELGSTLMETQLEFPDDHFACFHVSSIGRSNGKPNVGSLSQWERVEVIKALPPAFNLNTENQVELPEQLGYLREALDDIYVSETFDAFSINKPNDISPYRVLEPLLWLLERIEQSQRSGTGSGSH